MDVAITNVCMERVKFKSNWFRLMFIDYNHPKYHYNDINRFRFLIINCQRGLILFAFERIRIPVSLSWILENLEDMFSRYYMHSTVLSMLNYTHKHVTLCEWESPNAVKSFRNGQLLCSYYQWRANISSLVSSTSF